MKSIELLALGIRLVSIGFSLKLLQFMVYGFNAIQHWRVSSPDESVTLWLALYGVSTVVLAAACYVVIRFPLCLSRWLLPKAKQDEPVFNGSINDLSIAAFMVLGVYILSGAIPDLLYHAGMLIQMYQGDDMIKLHGASAKQEKLIAILSVAVEAGIGVYLCLQAKALNALLLKLRRARTG